jgi:SAM-dependent methyltransferase
VADATPGKAVFAAGTIDYDYDRFYTLRDFQYEEPVEATFLRALLHGLLRLPPRAAVVDLGCGTGFDAWLMDRMGYQVVGIDTSRVAIEKARQRGGTAQFLHGDALALRPEQVARFDLAYCSGFMVFNWATLPHDPAAVAAARALVQYLRPGGGLVFIWDSILTGERWSPYPDMKPERMWMNYTVAQVRALWEQVEGCEISHAVATHKRLARLLGRRAFSRGVEIAMTAAVQRFRRPVQIVVVVRRVTEPG